MGQKDIQHLRNQKGKNQSEGYRGGNTQRFAGIEQAQIRSTLEVAKKIVLTPFQCLRVGTLLYLANRFTANEMLGLVH